MTMTIKAMWFMTGNFLSAWWGGMKKCIANKSPSFYWFFSQEYFSGDLDERIEEVRNEFEKEHNELVKKFK